MMRLLLSLGVLGVLVGQAWGVVHTVSSAAQLTTAMSAAVAGDEIVLQDGTYSGTFTTNNAGTSGSKITLRAANRHQAVLVGDNVCDRSHEGLLLADAYWVVKDLKFTQHGRAIRITANNVEVQHNVLEGYREEGIRVDGGDTNFIHHNVIGYSKGCTGTDSPGIFVVTDANSNIVQDNIVIATGNDGYTCAGGGGCDGGAKFGYGIFVANNSDSSLIQGNLLLANGGKGVLRLLSDGVNSAGLTGSTVRDNAFLWGEGGVATDDCNDDGNTFLNNLFVGNYFWNWYTKGNDTTQNRGHHTFSKNLAIETPFSRGNVGFITTSGGCPNGGGFTYKVANTLRDNIFYSADTLAGGFDNRNLLTLGGPHASIIATASDNLFWAPSSTGTWITGYTYQGSDIHASGSVPLFTNAAAGNFTLQAASPGKADASDSTDMGIAYNSALKQSWIAAAFALPTQENTGLTGATSTSFTVNPARSYQVWFYIPTSHCNQGLEQFTIEGSTADLVRDIAELNSTANGVWISAAPQRYITLGRHQATDGTLNISWQHTSCVDKLFIRELPTSAEAYALIAGSDILTGLVAYLPFEEGAGLTAQDSTANDHDGTLSTAEVVWVAGLEGSSAVAFDTNDELVTISGLLGGPGAVTVAALVKPTALSAGGGEVISLGDHVGLRVSSTQVTGFYYTGSAWLNTLASVALSTTQPSHVAYVVQTGSQQVYVNGALVASTTNAAPINYAGLGSNTVIAAHGNGLTTFPFAGVIDAVRVYARALTSTDIAALAVFTPPVVVSQRPRRAVLVGGW